MIDQPGFFLPEELSKEIADASQADDTVDGRRVHPKNRLNEMTGEEWLYFTKSVITTSYPSVYSQKLRKQHGANKPPQLMALLVEFFTKSTARVLDPFAGVGGTLIGSSMARPSSRDCVGIEIAPQWTDIYHNVLAENPDLPRQSMVLGDCLDVMDRWLDGREVVTTDGALVRASEQDPFDFIAMDPPYNIHLRQTMSGKGGAAYSADFNNRRSDYNMRSEMDGDLANLPDFDSYLSAMERVFSRCVRLLRPGKYMAVIIRNAYQNGEYLFTHAELARRAKTVGLVPKGEIVWYQAGSRLRPYGYPFNYVPNISHQFILVLQRPPEKATKVSRNRKAAGHGTT